MSNPILPQSANTLAAALAMLQHGAFAVECDDKLANVIRSVEQTGKAGKLTVTLDFKKSGSTVMVVAKVTDKAPEAPVIDTFWATDKGGLTVQNPAQQNLELRTVETPARAVVDVQQAARAVGDA